MYALIYGTNPTKPIMTGDYHTLTALKEYAIKPYWNTNGATKVRIEYYSDIGQQTPFKIEIWEYEKGVGTHITESRI